jgi:hypothetical protein
LLPRLWARLKVDRKKSTIKTVVKSLSMSDPPTRVSTPTKLKLWFV